MDPKSIEKAYNSVVIGKFLPNLMHCSGAAMNYLTKTANYDVNKWYQVTAGKVTEMEIES